MLHSVTTIGLPWSEIDDACVLSLLFLIMKIKIFCGIFDYRRSNWCYESMYSIKLTWNISPNSSMNQNRVFGYFLQQFQLQYISNTTQQNQQHKSKTNKLWNEQTHTRTHTQWWQQRLRKRRRRSRREDKSPTWNCRASTKKKRKTSIQFAEDNELDKWPSRRNADTTKT